MEITVNRLKELDVIELIPGYNVNITDTSSILTLSEHNTEFLGKFIVTHTTFDGGGTGHGSHDVYPDGHHVWCVSAANNDIKIDFYQSGSFVTVNEIVKVVGSAKVKWEIDE